MGSETTHRSTRKKSPSQPAAQPAAAHRPARTADEGRHALIERAAALRHGTEPPHARSAPPVLPGAQPGRAQPGGAPRGSAPREETQRANPEGSRPRRRASSRPCPVCATPGLVRVPRRPEDRNDPAKRGLLRMRCQAQDCNFEGLLPRHRRESLHGREVTGVWFAAVQRLAKRWRVGTTVALAGAVVVVVVAAGFVAYADAPSLRALASGETRAALKR